MPVMPHMAWQSGKVGRWEREKRARGHLGTEARREQELSSTLGTPLSAAGSFVAVLGLAFGADVCAALGYA